MRPEGTIGRLRYLLGGDRPSQTTRLALSGRQLYGRPLDASPRKSGISPAPPPPPRGRVRWLPPILRMPRADAMPSCSKAPRGLFVLSRGTRIFTGTSISPSPRSRQCSSRYAFRAGRNLPDKEFRYLRTVHCCCSSLGDGCEHFCRTLYVAAQIGLYHPSNSSSSDGLACSL